MKGRGDRDKVWMSQIPGRIEAMAWIEDEDEEENRNEWIQNSSFGWESNQSVRPGI